MPSFPIVPGRTAVLFFDTVNVYLRPEDRRITAAVDASGVIPAMQKVQRLCREEGIAIFYAQPDHRPDLKDFKPHVVDRGPVAGPGESPRLTGPPTVFADSWGAQVIDELAPQPGDYVIKKHRWSAFFQTHLELSLRTAGIDTLMLAGASIEVGVASTAYAARDLDFSLIILRDACRSNREGLSEVYEEFFMDRVFPLFARVMTVDQVAAAIAHSSERK